MSLIPRQPSKVAADDLSKGASKTLIDGGWHSTRQVANNAFSWTTRWKLAFAVLVGKADAVFWYKQ